MVVGLLRAPYVIPLHLHIDRHRVDAIKERDFIRCAQRAALGASAVVTVDVDDERVIELAHVLDGLNDTPYLVVVICLVGGEDFHLLDEELFLLGRAVVPVLKDLCGPWLHRRAREGLPDTALLPRDDPGRRRAGHARQPGGDVRPDRPDHQVPRREAGAAAGQRLSVRLAGRRLVDATQVIDGIISHAGDEVPTRLAIKRINLGGVAEQVRLPLVGVAADETVEILEAHAGRPFVKRPDLAGGKRGYVVILAKP